jgi:hypothetical protein
MGEMEKIVEFQEGECEELYVELCGERGKAYWKRRKNEIGKKIRSMTISCFINKNGLRKGIEGYYQKNQKCTVIQDRFYFVKKYGEKEGNQKYEERNSKLRRSLKGVNSLDYFVEKYGVEKGTILYEEKNKKIGKASAKKNLQGYIALHGKEKGKLLWENYCESCKRGKEFFQKKYGTQGEDKWKDWKSKIGFSLEKAIEKYGKEEGYKRWKERQERWLSTLDSKHSKEKMRINKLKAQTLENFIRRHGEERGKELFEQYIKKSAVGRASLESLEVFFPLIDWIFENKICDFSDIYLGIPEKQEWYIGGRDYYYLYDFTIPKYNLIIEYNGHAFHPNPRWNIEEWLSWRSPFSNESADEAFRKDVDKVNAAIKRGFKVLLIYDEDEEKLERCKHFIEEVTDGHNQREVLQ